jgi:hypothetical protein
MNKEVSFPIAKLLKEKNIKIDTEEVLFYRDEVNNIEEHQIKNRDVIYRADFNYIVDENEYQTYTIGEVVMWLYEKQGVWISVELCIVGSDEWEYGYKVVYLPKEFENAKRRAIYLATKESFQEGMSSYSGAWHTPTEAYEAAIEYTLNNLL